ncbi:ectoine/hydroxyectoine ABC transporter permease subunit EhuD [Spirillospora sp. CA-294931]|uniref:ectoine/hydroxyectoine ABC transporter permease subunit EhuD n=1 Tax=Spirillospora sp. CA-294931 TaxID=3240042 RepID=UPI003D8F7BA3
MNFDWNYAREVAPDLLTTGLKVTLQATAGGAVLAFVLGLVLALLLRVDSRWVRLPTRTFIEVIRSTPLVAQLFLLYYALPTFSRDVLGTQITLSALTAGIIGLGVHYACYTAEVYRAGIDGVPPGQWEASIALNLPRVRTWTDVILPQAIRRVLPPLGNYLIAIFKESPQLTLITVVDVVGLAQNMGSTNFKVVEPLTIAGLFFLIIAIPSSILVRRLERRLAQ